MKVKARFAGFLCWILLTVLVVLIYKYETLLTLPSATRTVVDKHSSVFEQNAHGATLILVLTYMRSGSSLVGDVLQHMPETFYVYEPLRVFTDVIGMNGTIEYVNGTIRLPPYNFQEEATDLLKNWFTCNITSLQESTLRDSLFLGKGLKTRVFNDCVKSQKRTGRNSQKKLQICAKMLKKICDESPMRIIKTIRMELSAVKGLMDVLPNLKIVHLVRDPRATLESQWRLSMCTPEKGGTAGCINKYCTRLENDVIEKEDMKYKYPGRLVTTFYESIASHPLEASEELYKFCGGDFTDNAKEYIYNITMAGNPNNCVICTVRSNSTEHIDSWKESMSAEFLNRVQERCNFVMKTLKYQMYHKRK